MNTTFKFHSIALMAAVLLNSGMAQAQKPQTPVNGQGTAGKVTKWTSATTVGDSNITEDKFGRVGIGVEAPTTRLAVAGVIESVSGGGGVGGGFKFPDGSVQKSAGLGANQIVGSENVIVTPSGNTVVISVQGLLKAGDAVTSFNGQRGDVTFDAVTSLNGASGGLTIQGAGNISVTRSGSTIEIAAAPGAATPVAHDATLTGDGSAATPLGIDVPLSLTGGGPNGSTLFVTNPGGNDERATAATFNGGQNLGNGFGGEGIIVRGGNAASGDGGPGIVTVGGIGTGAGNQGGPGILAFSALEINNAGPGIAGDFRGDVSVSGNLNVAGLTNRKIDHPLDPANKYLVHAAVESSEVLNVYSGNVTTDGRGVAVVTMPDWFEAANTDLRYQLTTIGTFARAMVAEKVVDNRFTIKTDAPNVEVSWQVTGVRADAAAKRAPFSAVEDKPADERGVFQTRYAEELKKAGQ